MRGSIPLKRRTPLHTCLLLGPPLRMQVLEIAASVIRVARQRVAPAVTLAGRGGDWLLEFAPIFGRAAVRRRAQIVLKPYKANASLAWSIIQLAAMPALIIACFIYGFYFALTAPYLLVPFAVPIALLAALIIWVLPDQRRAPTLPIEFLFAAFMIFLIVWPDYLAISLTGLPWITMRRIVGLPLAALLLVSLSVSRDFRTYMKTSVNGIPLVWRFFCGFIAVQIATTIISPSPIASAQIVFNCQVYWTTIFVISCIIFRDTRYIERYWMLLCLLAVPVIVTTALESSQRHILWVNHIPSFLRVPDASIQNILAPSFRPGINVYRAKAMFRSPLALAEYLALLTPLFLHFGLYQKRLPTKAICFAMVPILFIAIRMTDARLGVAGMVVSLLLYGMLWSVIRWRSHPRDLLAAATVYAYPAVCLAGIGAVFASNRLNAMVFGGGAQASSSAARNNQLQMALDKLFQAPWGHGTGQSGLAMGYGEGSFISVDNYFITISLDYGVLGIIFWYGMFIIAIFESVRYCLSRTHGNRPEARLLAPLAVSLTAFLIIKWVHGQDDNHAMLFMMLGMVSALIYNLRNSSPTGESLEVTIGDQNTAPMARNMIAAAGPRGTAPTAELK